MKLTAFIMHLVQGKAYRYSKVYYKSPGLASWDQWLRIHTVLELHMNISINLATKASSHSHNQSHSIGINLTILETMASTLTLDLSAFRHLEKLYFR